MKYAEVLEIARQKLSPGCVVCPECNGLACRGKIPGVGGIGSGKSFIRCLEYLKNIDIHLDTVYEDSGRDTSVELFGRTFSMPVFIAPIGGMKLNYKLTDLTDGQYSTEAVLGARLSGIAAFTGDGPQEGIYESTMPAVDAGGGVAIPTIKPWGESEVISRIRLAEEHGAMAIAMDIDSAGLVNLALLGKPVFPKGAASLRRIIESTKLPFVVKGVMTPAAALHCVEAGAYGIVVSSHGGRVLEDALPTCAVLPAIREAVGTRMKIFVDGGIRKGSDVFKALALGADAVLIGRPYGIANIGGGREGVRLYSEWLRAHLEQTMLMAGCATLADITRDKLSFR